VLSSSALESESSSHRGPTEEAAQKPQFHKARKDAQCVGTTLGLHDRPEPETFQGNLSEPLRHGKALVCTNVRVTAQSKQ
jgi:hypothetical protein